MTFEDVDALRWNFPGVTVARRGQSNVDGRRQGFRVAAAASRPTSSDSDDETATGGRELLDVCVGESPPDDKDGVAAMAPPGFFTIPHATAYPQFDRVAAWRARRTCAPRPDAFRAVGSSRPTAKRARPVTQAGRPRRIDERRAAKR